MNDQKEQAKLFLESQIFVLMLLTSLKNNNNNRLTPVQNYTCENAMIVVAQTIQNILDDFPELEQEVLAIEKQLAGEK